jgi:hypothetical protein
MSQSSVLFALDDDDDPWADLVDEVAKDVANA